MTDETGLVTKVITEETTETITTTRACPSRKYEKIYFILAYLRFRNSHYLKVQFEGDSDDETIPRPIRFIIIGHSVSFFKYRFFSSKSISQDSGFDDRELLQKVEKLERENSQLKVQEEQLLNQIKNSPIKGTIGVSFLF